MLRIEFKSFSDHETIIVSLGKSKNHVDLYCYCMDYALLKEDQATSKGFFNLFLMLENWKYKIKTLDINEKDYLPFDYSDQHIGFFVIERISSEEINIQDAFTSEFTGWNTAPSQLYVKNLLSKPYKLTGDLFRYNKTKLLQELETAVENLSDVFYVRKKE